MSDPPVCAGVLMSDLVKQKNPKALRAILRRYGRGAKVAVGFPAGSSGASAKYPDGASVLDVAFSNEFGNGNIPERSFLRAGTRENTKRFTKLAGGLVPRINSGTMDIAQASELIGLDAQAAIREFIINLSDPPNAPLTVAIKKSSNPLVDTGLLGQSVEFEVRKP